MRKTLTSSFGEILLSPMGLEDVGKQADYLYCSSEAFLTRIGFDVKKLPTRAEFIQGLESRIKSQKNADENQKIHTAIIARINNKAIGVVILNSNVDPENAHAHFHIWDENLRGKGLGEHILKGGLKLLMDHQNRSTAFIEPHKDNVPMNKLIQKCGFNFVEDSVFSGPITHEFKSKKYLIERAKL